MVIDANVLALLRWKQTRRGYDGDEQLLQTGFDLLASDAQGLYGTESALQRTSRACNISAERIVTEILQFAIMLVTKPKRDDQGGNQSRAVLRLLHLGLKALRATAPTGSSSLTIPLNSCNLLLSAMADTLESASTANSSEDTVRLAVMDVEQIFLFLFGMTTMSLTPSFHMYKPPTNVYTTFMQRACMAIFVRLDSASTSTDHTTIVRLLHAIMVVFQDLQYSQLNKKKVFLAIAKTSFRDIVTYRHALVRHQTVDGIADVLAVLDRVVTDALFDSEHLREYEGALTTLTMWQTDDAHDDEAIVIPMAKKQRRGRKDAVSSTSSSLISYQRHLFDELRNLLTDATVKTDLKESLGGLLMVLVRGFATRIRAAAHDKIEDSKSALQTSKKRVAHVIATTSTTYSPFKFWAELCAVVFAAYETSSKDVALLVTAYDALFASLCESDVYRVTEDTEEQEQFHMMETILGRFMAMLLAQRDNDHVIVVYDRVCGVIAHAVECTPNLANASLATILSVVGAAAHRDLGAASRAMTALLHAYESMRLMDAFLRACCACDHAAEDDDATNGLYMALAHPTTDHTLRKTLLTLPPGQLDVVWRLLTDRLAVLCAVSSSSLSSMALVRAILAVFVQEIHITPQNRAKMGDLVVEMYDKVLAPLVHRREHKTWSAMERELLSVVGELLALYDGLPPTTRAKTLDLMLDSFDKTGWLVLLKAVLPTTTQHEQPHSAIAGLLKVGIHRLRKAGRDDTEARRVATLLVQRVCEWRCWEAVAFYLPDLVASVAVERDAVALWDALLTSVLHGDAAARRILEDAAFYEIALLQRVAPRVFADTINKTTDIEPLAEYVVSMPRGYLTPVHCRELLVAVLDAHRRTHSVALAQWIQLNAIEMDSAIDKTVDMTSWIHDVLTNQATSSSSLVRVAVGLARHNPTATRAMEHALTGLLAAATSENMCAWVVEAIAIETADKHAVEETFVRRLVDKLDSTPPRLLGEPRALPLLTALVQYGAASSPPRPHHARVVRLLEHTLGPVLAQAMQCLVGHANETNDDDTSGALHLIETFCEVYPSFRTHVPLETFGCLLAVALVLAARRATNEDAPLCALLAHANREEFRLVMATLVQEMRTRDATRNVAAWTAMARVLDPTDRKLSSTRRQILNEYKTPLLELCRGHLAMVSSSSSLTTIATLRVFVLVYTKPELFTWKQHELLQVVDAFAPLQTLLTTTTTTAWTLDERHEIWLLSYTLVLRLVRHHFASLVHVVHHLVDAFAALLAVLVATSSSSSSPSASLYTLEWASNLARLYGYLKPHDTVIRKHVVYLLIGYIRSVTHGQLPLALQHKLRPGVYTLLEICSLYEKEQLYASLDATGKSLLKSLDTSFKLTHRYVGKV